MQKLVRERGLKNRIRVDSAGTHVPRVGIRPDPRATQVAKTCGCSISGYRSRKLEADDYERYDYIVAMDRDNLHYMQRTCPPQFSHKLLSIMDYSEQEPAAPDVPDPYFGNPEGFQRVVDLLQPACSGLLRYLARQHGLD